MLNGSLPFLSLLLCVAFIQTVSATQDATDLPASKRGLTATDIKPVLLAGEGNRYCKDVQQKNFKGSVLGYVTPWNNQGYDVATRWRAKFTHISPVWYQLRQDDPEGFQLTGGQDVDQKWIARLREPVSQQRQCSSDADADSSSTCSAYTATSKAPPLIVPRVIFELNPQQLGSALEHQPGVISMIVREIQQQGLDGLVLEGWLQWSAMGLLGHEQVAAAVLLLVKNMADLLHSAGKVLILAIPPVVPSSPGRPGALLQHMQQLAGVVDGFSLMSYDYSAAGSAGPNFPLPWQQRNVEQLLAAPDGSSGAGQVSPGQVLMGVPFYGYDFSRLDAGSGSSKKRKAADNQPVSANPIMGEAFLAALRKVKPKLKWEEQHAEHRIKYKEGNMRHTVYYPTPAALAARIKLAEQLGIGLSIWELGQGMDSFLDLL